MNCKKAQKQMGLRADADLSEKNAAKLRGHIAECASCQKEWREIEAALAQVKALAQKTEAKDWEEGDWKNLMGKITSQKVETKPFPFKFHVKPALAYGIALIALCGILIALLLLQSRSGKSEETSFLPQKIVAAKTEASPALPSDEKTSQIKETPQPQLTKEKPPPLQRPVTPQTASSSRTTKIQPAQPTKETTLMAEAESQDTLSMTLVSQQTGLKVVWIFNKNFEWKEDRK